MSDQYKTITAKAYGEFKDKGSKFHAYAYPVLSEEDIQQALEIVKKEHFKARHHCYGYRLGYDGQLFRSNDDGEPSGTAGRPILGQIDSRDLTNVFVVVVRYFGGTKLGTSGLINAYKTSASEALDAANIITKTLQNVYRLQFEYAIMGEVMQAAKRMDLNIVDQQFETTAHLDVAFPKSESEQQLLTFKALLLQLPESQVEAMESIPNLEVSFLRTV
ncbi:MAG: YigZ family protein [Bacteroidota bacterium]